MTTLKTKLKQERSLEEWQIAHIKAGIADADAGRLTPHEQVVKEWEKRFAARMDRFSKE